MNLDEFESTYERLVEALSKSKSGLRPPSKYRAGKPTKEAIVLTYLFKYMGKPVSKSELTGTVRHFHPDTNDVQQGRHLAAQRGFWIESGTRGDSGQHLKSNEYMLVTLEQVYPGWRGHRATSPENFVELKERYANRCATCGSSEGERNFVNPSVKTQLQAGHMDPRTDLTPANTIPQCQVCNRAYRDWFIFYPNGRVRSINPASPRWLGVSDGLEDGTFGNEAGR